MKCIKCGYSKGGVGLNGCYCGPSSVKDTKILYRPVDSHRSCYPMLKAEYEIEIPDGWRRLSLGESIELGDRFFCLFNAVDGNGEMIPSEDHWLEVGEYDEIGASVVYEHFPHIRKTEV